MQTQLIARLLLPIAAATAAAAVAGGASADSITLRPVADGTLIQPSDANQYAIGAAYNIYCGRVGPNGLGTFRRALVRFDLSAIPAGSTILTVSLRVYMSQTNSGTQDCRLHRVLESWGEGASFAFGGGGTLPEANDATWSFRFWPGVPWSSPGGVFAAAASATRSVGAIGSYTWASTAALVSDVQAWVADPAANHGWVIIGNEALLDTAKRFESRESGDVTRHPTLVVTYNPPGALVGDLNSDGKVNGGDLSLLLAAWGGSGPADLNGNGVVEGGDIAALLTNWRP